MQTLSRYFVAFLLILVSHFIGDSESENKNEQAYKPQTEIQQAPADIPIPELRQTRCS